MGSCCNSRHPPSHPFRHFWFPRKRKGNLLACFLKIPSNYRILYYVWPLCSSLFSRRTLTHSNTQMCRSSGLAHVLLKAFFKTKTNSPRVGSLLSALILHIQSHPVWFNHWPLSQHTTTFEHVCVCHACGTNGAVGAGFLYFAFLASFWPAETCACGSFPLFTCIHTHSSTHIDTYIPQHAFPLAVHRLPPSRLNSFTHALSIPHLSTPSHDTKSPSPNFILPLSPPSIKHDLPCRSEESHPRS